MSISIPVHTAHEAVPYPFVTPTPPCSQRQMLAYDVDAMPYTLTVRVTGFDGLPEAWIMRLEQALTEFFFQSPGRLNGVITIFADLYGDAGQMARRCQMFLFSLRTLIAPSLNFSIEFDYNGRM